VGDSLDRKGRNALWVYKDTVPSNHSFSLDFGDQKVIYEFSSIDFCDFARVEVWYGLTPGAANYIELQASANQGTIYYDPVTSSVKDEIKG